MAGGVGDSMSIMAWASLVHLQQVVHGATLRGHARGRRLERDARLVEVEDVLGAVLAHDETAVGPYDDAVLLQSGERLTDGGAAHLAPLGQSRLHERIARTQAHR